MTKDLYVDEWDESRNGCGDWRAHRLLSREEVQKLLAMPDQELKEILQKTHKKVFAYRKKVIKKQEEQQAVCDEIGNIICKNLKSEFPEIIKIRAWARESYDIDRIDRITLEVRVGTTLHELIAGYVEYYMTPELEPRVDRVAKAEKYNSLINKVKLATTEREVIAKDPEELEEMRNPVVMARSNILMGRIVNLNFTKISWRYYELKKIEELITEELKKRGIK